MYRIILIIGIVLITAGNCIAKEDCLAIIDKADFHARFIEISDECITILVNTIVKGRDTEQKIKALNVLKKSKHSRDVDFFKHILESVHSIPVQQTVIEILSDMRDRRVLPIIIEYVTSPFFAVRESVIMALRESGDDRMYPYIIRLAGSDDVIKRIYALEALYHLYDNRFYDIVMQLLNDSNKSVRYFALECVSHNEIHNALPTVRNIALKDENDEVRVKALNVLGSLRDKTAYGIFVRSLSDASEIVREAAVDEMKPFLSRESALHLSRRLLLETEIHIKRMIIKSLVTAGKTGDINGLRHIVLNDENASLRIYAVWALGVIQDERTAALLIEALYDQDFRVRAEAANALGNFKGRKVVESLLDKYKTEDEHYVKTAILFSLMKICDINSLRQMLEIYSREKDKVLAMIAYNAIHHIIIKKTKYY